MIGEIDMMCVLFACCAVLCCAVLRKLAWGEVVQISSRTEERSVCWDQDVFEGGLIGWEVNVHPILFLEHTSYSFCQGHYQGAIMTVIISRFTTVQ
jgi:hypothetical protein